MNLDEAKHMRNEVEQIFIDAAHWNRTHPGEEPIDPDPDGQLRELANRLDQTIGIPENLRTPAA